MTDFRIHDHEDNLVGLIIRDNPSRRQPHQTGFVGDFLGEKFSITVDVSNEKMLLSLLEVIYPNSTRDEII